MLFRCSEKKVPSLCLERGYRLSHKSSSIALSAFQ
jgi:hypothetical protein